jgi:hypothetical protein
VEKEQLVLEGAGSPVIRGRRGPTVVGMSVAVGAGQRRSTTGKATAQFTSGVEEIVDGATTLSSVRRRHEGRRPEAGRLSGG